MQRAAVPVEDFRGTVHDPCCGFGTIPETAKRAGLVATGADLVDRGYADGQVEDFLASRKRRDNIVCNPPFGPVQEVVGHALSLTKRKVAITFPAARVNTAHWMRETPLRRIYYLTPRPSMPPGHYIAAGKKPKSGRRDYCWMVFERGFNGSPEANWLHRDEGQENA